MSRLRGERGSALMMAVIILFVILGLGTALMATANGQKAASANQQSGESAYSMAEAALNAQIYSLSVKWPTANNGPSTSSASNYGYPSSCNAASNGASYCPSASDLSAYPSNTQTCPAGTPGDAWTPGPTRSAWTTYVRDGGKAGTGQQQLFSDATEQTAAPYNSSYLNGANNYVWVRAVGTVNCKTAVVIAEVSMQSLALNFPKLVLNANGFSITNNGQQTVLNPLGVSGSASQLSARCGGSAYTPPPPSSCVAYNNSNQISPAPSWVSPPSPTPVLSASQLAAAKAMAQANGTYFPASTDCSTITAAQLAGSPVYIEGSSTCNISIPANPVINSQASPGLLILLNGTLTFTGSATYHGVIYGVNQGGLSSNVVTLGGTSTVVGGVAVDGNGTLALGSSGNGVGCAASQKCGDLMYNAAAFNTLIGFGGADQTPNTFRQLPAGQ